MGRPKREIHEDDKLVPVTMTLNNRHKKTLDRLMPRLGAPSRSATAAKLLEAVEYLIRNGDLTSEQILAASIRQVTPQS